MKRCEDLGLLTDIVSNLKAQGKRIVLSNGGFNLLHVGHIRSLREAKSLGDILIVAVNSDDSLRKLKGPDYPIMPLSERMEIIEALEFVDYVIPFYDLTVTKILLTLNPDIHAKGKDYTLDNLPERETVLSYGGKIAFVGDPKNHSVTDMVRHIRGYSSLRREKRR